ncbi:baseplate complex protein [Gilvimarinus japonicus]|uniref:Uncharacterized protein n=1 Tax=Gilvimarinus japonicus TaxID=1796469 RepID=A0ABV7HV51_9GAMM
MNLNEYKVPEYSLKVRGQMPYDSDPLGGQTSGSSRAHKGIKPKMLFVSLQIPMNEPVVLERLLAVAEATDAAGALVVYDLQDNTGNAMKIRQVQFGEVFTVSEKESVRAWDISFVLHEYYSVPEKKEQRMTTGDAPPQVAAGATVSGGEIESQSQEVKLSPSYWKAALDKLESYLDESNAEGAQ